MHESLRRRLLRAIESLPEDRVYQVLDYIEFLESRYGTRSQPEPGGLQRFAERLEDRIRARSTLSPSNLREAFELLSTADRLLSTLSGVEESVRREASAAVRRSPQGVDAAPAAARPGPSAVGKPGLPGRPSEVAPRAFTPEEETDADKPQDPPHEGTMDRSEGTPRA